MGSGAVKFLGAEDERDAGNFLEQLGATALGHAPEKSEGHMGTMAANVGGDGAHFADGLLLGHVTHAAGVEEDDVGDGFARRK